MDRSQRPQHEITPKLAAAFLFLCTAISIASALLVIPEGPFYDSASVRDGTVEFGVQGSPFVFVCASILVFFRHRLGYGLGMAAGLIALPWFVLREISLASWNSWIFLNYEDPTPSAGGVYVTFVKLKILSAAS